DTVKQAEVFATIREAYGIPRDDKLRLRDFPTLAHVIRFVRDRRPDLGPEPARVDEEARAGKAQPEPPALRGFAAAERVPRRVPITAVRPPCRVCGESSIVLGAGARVLVACDHSGVAEALMGQLATRGVSSLAVRLGEDDTDFDAQLRQLQHEGRVDGVYWLPGLDPVGELRALDLAAWRSALHARVKRLYTTLRILYDSVATPGHFVIAATRLGGQHGYDEAGALEPFGGAITGFVKAFARERPDALVKAVDFGTELDATAIAQALIEETLHDPGVVEVGRTGELRCTVALEDRPVADGRAGLALGRSSVVVVTGAAGSIVSAIVADLASAAAGGTFHLLDRVPEPRPDDPDLPRLASDRESLKRELVERLRTRGDRPTPALVERELAALERANAALEAIQAVRGAGGVAHYHAVDLLDGEAVAKVMNEVRDSCAGVDVVVHAAGLEASHFLRDKEPEEFDRVFDVKCDGWFNLSRALGDHPVGVFVAFGSIAGRFGNAGQTDYSAANDLLAKCISALRRSRPESRAIVLDWTGWARIGMASRGSIPKLLKQAGIELLEPGAGIPWLRRELVQGGASGEVLVAGALGVLSPERAPTATLDSKALELRGGGPLLAGSVARLTPDGVTLATRLDPTEQAFLNDHRIDGTAVLPGVMGLEGFAEVASLLAPDWRVAALDDVRFLTPFKFYRDAPRELTFRCTGRPSHDGLIADCELLGKRTLADRAGQSTSRHFAGRVRLQRALGAPARMGVPSPPSGPVVEASDLYRLYFHGPAYRVLDRTWRDGPAAVALLTRELPPNHAPADLPLRAAPRLVEACFQTAGVWEMGVLGRFGLPQQVESIVFHLPPEAATGWLFAIATPGPDGQTFGAWIVDASGHVLVRLRGYRTVEVPGALDAALLAPLQAAMAPESPR
ncbi:MAG TPA: SDR family NAD(P)-dependent oxidoreductase, partial [Myxococcota bacterium]|nr:SDR family NAD(P)-dependent oxidoreductase [Myxococcota bacterium]